MSIDEELTTSESRELIIKMLLRVDAYTQSVNSKATTVITLAIFFAGSIALKSSEIFQLLEPVQKRWAALFLLSGAALSIGACFFALRAFHPFLQSANKSGIYHSVVFFGSIAEIGSDTQFLSVFQGKKSAAIKEDLITQLWIVSRGLDVKFKRLSVGVLLLLVGPLLSLAVVVSMVAYNSIGGKYG